VGTEVKTAFSTVDIRPHLNLIAGMLFLLKCESCKSSRSDYAEALHLVEERSAVKTKSRGGSSRPAQFPVGAQACSENFLTHLVFKGCICNLAL